jgi:hypothetical protein
VYDPELSATETILIGMMIKVGLKGGMRDDAEGENECMRPILKTHPQRCRASANEDQNNPN